MFCIFYFLFYLSKSITVWNLIANYNKVLTFNVYLILQLWNQPISHLPLYLAQFCTSYDIEHPTFLFVL